MLTDAKKIGLRLKAAAERLGIKQVKKEKRKKGQVEGAIPFGIDQSTLSRWFNGENIPGGEKQQFCAFACWVGMSFEDTPTHSVEKYVPKEVAPKDAALLEGIVTDLVTLEQRGYPMQVTASQLKAALIQGERDPIPAEDPAFESVASPTELAQARKGLYRLLGDYAVGTPEERAYRPVLLLIDQLIASQKQKDRAQPDAQEQSSGSNSEKQG